MIEEIKNCSNCRPRPNKMINAYFHKGLTNCVYCGRLLSHTQSISQTRQEVRADTISQFVSGDIEAPQLNKFIKARMKAFLLIAKNEGIKIGRQEVIEEIKQKDVPLVKIKQLPEDRQSWYFGYRKAVKDILEDLNKK